MNHLITRLWETLAANAWAHSENRWIRRGAAVSYASTAYRYALEKLSPELRSESMRKEERKAFRSAPF